MTSATATANCQQRSPRRVQPGRGAARQRWRDRVRRRSGPPGDPLCETGRRGILPMHNNGAHAQVIAAALRVGHPISGTTVPIVGTIRSTTSRSHAGAHHRYSAHAEYGHQANMWGAARLVCGGSFGPCTVGSLDPELRRRGRGTVSWSAPAAPRRPISTSRRCPPCLPRAR